MTVKQTRNVEYYRCWAGSSGDSGTWDTDYIDIPKDTLDDDIDKAILTACNNDISWSDEAPVFVGLYCLPNDEDELSDDG